MKSNLEVLTDGELVTFLNNLIKNKGSLPSDLEYMKELRAEIDRRGLKHTKES